MRDADFVVEDIIKVLREQRIAQVPGYVPFHYVDRKGDAIIVERRNGKEARVPLSRLRRAIEAVREDQTIS